MPLLGGSARDDVPPWDEGNKLLEGGPAQLTTRKLATPQGMVVATTVRTTSATVTVLLSAADFKAWARQMQAEADQLPASSRLVVPGPGAAPG
jgi:hypothetical protein